MELLIKNYRYVDIVNLRYIFINHYTGIYYEQRRNLLFSGTGNSLHVAKELQKRILVTSLVAIVNLFLDTNCTYKHARASKKRKTGSELSK